MSTPDVTSHEADVLAHLDERALVDSLAALVRVPSVGGSEAEVEVQELAAQWASELDGDVDLWDIDLDELAADPMYPGAEVEREAAKGMVATWGGARTAALALQGHLDVVPVGDPETWQGSDPFSAEVREGFLFGRGAADMKAGVAANFAVVRTLLSAGVALTAPLSIQTVVGEEDGGLGAFATLRRGYRADAAVITEPTGGRLLPATAGALTFRIEVAGRAAHGSLRHSGVSAFEAFLPLHAALVELETRRNTMPDPMFETDLPYALSFGIVSAGDWASTVPDRLVAEGRFGVRLDEDPRTARTAFEDVVNQAAIKDPWLRENRPLVTWPGGQFASGLIDSAHPLVDQVTAAVVDTLGVKPPIAASPYGSDLRLYTGIGGIPTLHYGPGEIEQAHAAQERIDLGQLIEVTRALVVLALRRCG